MRQCVFAMPGPYMILVLWERPRDFADTVAFMQIQGESLDWPYIEHWCTLHDTLDLLAEAKASVVWEEDEWENARRIDCC